MYFMLYNNNKLLGLFIYIPINTNSKELYIM